MTFPTSSSLKMLSDKPEHKMNKLLIGEKLQKYEKSLRIFFFKLANHIQRKKIIKNSMFL